MGRERGSEVRKGREDRWSLGTEGRRVRKGRDEERYGGFYTCHAIPMIPL